MLGYIEDIETMGLVDGPGIRTVVFLSGCTLRCKYCQNPEMWQKNNKTIAMSAEELAKKIKRYIPYYGNNGGVTFSGGEPILQADFIIQVAKILKKDNIHIAIDTAGVGLGNYAEILKYIDLIILDIKHTNKDEYYNLTGVKIDKSLEFIDALNKSGKKVWIRQVMVPSIHDNNNYLKGLCEFLTKIKNIERIDFLPYHKLGDEKYERLNINNPFKEKKAMDKDKCDKLYQKFMILYEEKCSF